MGEHHPRHYATIRAVDGERAVVYAFSCGPCGIYGKLFRSEQRRSKLARQHGGR